LREGDEVPAHILSGGVCIPGKAGIEPASVDVRFDPFWTLQLRCIFRTRTAVHREHKGFQVGLRASCCSFDDGLELRKPAIAGKIKKTRVVARLIAAKTS
jgi:hypothetical protein